MSPLLIAVMGSTASGKTALAEAIADQIGAQLINADNFQCYRFLDIGTAKPDDPVKYELLSFLNPDEPFGVGAWVRLAAQLLTKPGSYVVVGGSGLNIRALFEGYTEMAGLPPEGLRESLNRRDLGDLVAELQLRSPEQAESVDLKNPVRVRRALERLDSPREPVAIDLSSFKKVKLGLDAPPEWVDPRIEQRVDDMLAAGWLAEVARIKDMGYGYDDPGIKAHGYRNLWDVLAGRKDLSQARFEIVTMVRQYAKRQRTWMRKERNLCKISAENGQRSVADAFALIERGE